MEPNVLFFSTLTFRLASRVTGSDDACAAKAQVALEDDSGLSSDDVALRRAVDEELTCFVSLDTWRDAHLGLALVVLPRTNRERRKGLLPKVMLTGDVLSTDSYNRGVRTLVQSSAPAQLDREADNAEEVQLLSVVVYCFHHLLFSQVHSVVVSSTRGRINAWLPLYINEHHWRYVRRWARAAISIIGSQFNDQFSAPMCLAVCAKLVSAACFLFPFTHRLFVQLIQTVVRFTVDNDVSERTLQQFCDVHRVFLQLATDHPDVAELADERLEQFINDPNARGRETSQFTCRKMVF